MPEVPLPTGFQGLEQLARTKERLTNLFNTGKNQIIRTPGVQNFSTGIGSTRGMEFYRDLIYVVSDDRLITVDEDGLVDNTIGEIQDITKDVAFTVGNKFLTIVVKGGKGYFFETGGALTEITDPNYQISIDADIINGINIYVPEDGSPLFYSDVNRPDIINATSFLDAELLPDKNTGVMVLNNDVYAMGEDIIEVFRATGQSSPAFLRVDGAAIQVGYVGGKVLYKDRFAFLGRTRGQDYGFHIIGQGNAPKISNPAVDELLNTQYTPRELEAVIGDRFTWKGYEIIKFRLARHTLYYVGGNWGFIQTGITGITEDATWNPNYIRFAYGKFIIGDAVNTNIGTLEDINTEYGEDIQKEIITFVRGGRNNWFSVDFLELDCLAGQATPEGTIGLAVSNNAFYEKFGVEYYRPLGKLGDYGQRVVWNLPGGLGQYESYMGIRLVTTAAVDFATDGLNVSIQ